MPTQRPPTLEEAEYLKSQGVNPEGFLVDDNSQQETNSTNKNSIASTIAKTVMAHGGSYLGGGAGMAGATALGTVLAPETMGASFLIPAIVGAAGGLGGAYLGGKGQEALLGNKQRQLEQEAEEAREQHPIVAGATDIAGSAMAGGGKPSLKNLKSAGSQLIGKNALSDIDQAAFNDLGELGTRGTEQLAAQNEGRDAIGKIVGSSLLNPAINTGLDLATGQPITPGGIAQQIAGGALFSEQSRLGKMMMGHKANNEPLPELSSKDITTNPTSNEGNSLFNEKDETGNYKIPDELIKSQYLKDNLNTKSEMSSMTRDDALRAQADNLSLRQNNDYDSMRQSLHKDALDTISNKTTVNSDINKPSDQSISSNTPSQPVSEQPDITRDTVDRDNRIQAAINQQDKVKASLQSPEDIATREALIANSGKQPADRLTPTQPKDTIAAGSSDNNTSTQAAETSNRVTSLADATREYHKSLISGEDIADAKAKTEGENQRFNYHINELAKANQIKRAAIDIESQQQSRDNPLQRINDFKLARDEINKRNSTIERRQEGQSFLERPNTKRILNPDTILNQDLSKTPGIDSWLASKKVDTNGKLFDAFQGIPITLWNGSIDAIRTGIKAGKALHEAIKDGIAHIKANYKGVFNEDAYSKEMMKQEGEQSHPFGTTNGKEIIPEIKRMGKLGGITEPIYDRIASLAHKGARAVSDAFKLTDNTKDQYLGESWNKIKQIMDKVRFTKEDGIQLDKVAQWENLNHTFAPLSMFRTRAQRAVYNIERQVYDEVGKRRIANNEPVYRNGNPTKLQQDPTAHPTPLAPKITEMYKAGTDINNIAKHDADFISNAKAHGYTSDQAAKALSDFKSSIQGSMKNPGSNLSFFGGSRLSQSIPLPASFTKGGYATRLESYYKRMALDNAFYKHVESNPRVMSALGENKDAWGKLIPKDAQGGIANNDNVRTALHTFQGEATDTTSKTEGSITNLASTLFVSSPVIEMHKILSNTLNGAIAIADNPIEAAKTFTYMITHLSDGIQHATENGLIKMTAKSASNFFDNASTTAEKFQALSQGWRNISSLGGNTDKWNNGLMQSGFESAIPGKIAKANNGDITSQQLLKKWDPTYHVGKEYSTKDIQQLASIAAGYVHGTKDGRTMPPWMMKDTELSGFFKLAHWSVSQTNRFMSDIYTPATKGNIVPLVNALLGSAIGGYAIKQLREELQGKHGNIPDLNEIQASQEGIEGNKGLVAYNLIAAMQYAGFAGILSQGIKYPVDRIFKNAPQGAVFPLDEIASDLMKQIGDFTSAKANDPNFDWVDATMALWNHILTTDIQLTRIGFNQGVNNGLITGLPADKKILSDKLGQLRRFDIASKLPYDDQEVSLANPYMNIEQKKFKNEQDIGAAMKELPRLVQNILDNYSDKPDVMMSKLKALKENQYNTFPSLENKAPTFIKYMNYLDKLKGNGDADKEYMDYLQHKIINEAKSSVVP